ncbi:MULTISPECIES: DUF6879 family protein [Streptomyces]|uniref:DUF6879 family protein n=1 Tax=Streptomyces TaxID=1883 RepID=UPI0022493D96|nr:DUF6879 family protein [Streptomyces sp. JHD 1]MCX2967839.1 hypothetical protein [Streptomyces sp. JHD 1]
MTSQTVPPFAELLGACTRTAVHLETRDGYAIPSEDEEFRAWRAGDDPRDRPREEWWGAFHDAVVDAVHRGVTVRRARVVSEPLSEYILHEYACTYRNVEAGEDVRWLPRSQASDLLLPGNDLWIFDDRLIRYGMFSGNGELVGQSLEDDPDVVARHAAAFDAVWERAVPHANYTP